jgi:predicted DCC family thiol-disulfide oxidoreductase YuxK
MEHAEKPVLIYDGECRYCARQVRYWRRLTGDAIDYEPYQDAVVRHPEIPREDFARSIRLLAPGGEHYQGAAAAFRVLAAGGRPGGLHACRYLPGFAPLAEWGYRLVSRHRTGAERISRLLWGRERYPAQYVHVSWLFLRLLGLIYLAAFVSVAVQAEGLFGSKGILPLQEHLQWLTGQYPRDAWWMFPSVFWLNASDTAIRAVNLAGVLASVLLVCNILTRLMLPLLFLLYLSVTLAGQVFFNFQWDTLLLEAGFLAIFLPFGSPVILFLLHWVLFRLRFLSGAAKLLSGDAAWHNFSALNYYFETQPLAHTGSWYAHQLPDWLLRIAVGGVFFVELVVPFMMFLPRRPRLFAAWATILMQVIIILTSNHNFFNILTIVLCLFLLDDRALRILLPARWRRAPHPARAAAPGRLRAIGLSALAGVLVFASAVQGWEMFSGSAAPAWAAAVEEPLNALRAVNKYHVFPTIKTERLELVVEGSMDREHWKTYVFRYKPGDPSRRPRFVVPHQPRLDWMMWFVPARHPLNLMWFERFAERLLENAEPVTALLEHNPFPDEPPRYLRVTLYHYRFTTPEERRETGDWWVRESRGRFWPLGWFERTDR